MTSEQTVFIRSDTKNTNEKRKNKWYIKIKNFFASKDIIKKVKENIQNSKENSDYHRYVKELISRIYKKPITQQ